MQSLRTLLMTVGGAALLSSSFAGGAAVAAPNPSYCPNGERTCEQTLTREQVFQCAPYWLGYTSYIDPKFPAPLYCWPERQPK